jgi:DNA polymerase (family X)
MAVDNKKIAQILNEVADLLELKDENQFRIRSYRKAARTITGLSESITKKIEDGTDITSVPDIGESIASKIKEINETGGLSQLSELRNEIPKSLIEIMKLEQMGPQRTRTIYDNLQIDSIGALKKAAEAGEIEKLEGFGKKTSENILKEIKKYRKHYSSKRMKRHDAEEVIRPLLEYLEKKLEDITVAGSYRRQKETVGDIDILATCDDPEDAMKYFTGYEDTGRIVSQGKAKSTIKLKSGLQVDLRIIKKISYGSGLLYFTGSKEHSIALRKIGQEMKLKVNEYGIFKGQKRLASRTEKEMYSRLGLQYIPPELRENNGEIEAAREDKLPTLISLKDIKGDLQTHTNATDGHNTLEEMVDAARKFGYEYYAVTDHSKRVSIAHGLDEKRLAEQMREIDHLNKKLEQIVVLKSVEVDILEDGSLDLSDDILKDLDFVVCSIHYNRNLSRNKQTKRILKAMDNPYFNILAHPTGRLINERSGYDVDMEKIMEEARDRNCFLEINANPDRLDLNDHFIRLARDIGLKLSISTDSHSIDNLNYMKIGVAQARRGWLEKDDVINTRTWEDLKKLFRRK